MGLKFNPLNADLEYHKPTTGGGGTPTNAYIRPVDWPNIESLVVSNSFVGLYRVPKAPGNYKQMVAFTVTCPSGTYTVDWGDGTSNTYGTGVAADHLFDPANIVITDTSYGYKCAIIKVTATTNITSINFATLYSGAGQSYRTYQWLDLDIDASSLTNLPNLTFCSYALESFRLRNSSLSSYQNLFNGCNNLKKVYEVTTSSSLTSIGAMFNNCKSLMEIPLFNTSLVTAAAGFLSNCSSLISIPSFNFSSVTDASSMFTGCQVLESIPAIAFPAATTTAFMFQNCMALREVKVTSFASTTNVSSMFQDCTSLIYIAPTTTTALGASTSSMSSTFSGCNMITEIGFSHFSNSTNPFQTSATTAPKNLGTAALNTIFTALPTVTDSKVISIVLCPGKLTANTAIATAKGWTVLI